MSTTRKQVAEALEQTGENPADLVCFYREVGGKYEDPVGQPIRCAFDDLPQREFNEGYGGVEGEEVICFGPKYIYIKGCYDGAEWVQAVPRHPESVGAEIPVVGGG